MTLPGLLWLLGLALVFTGERWLFSTFLHWPATGGGLLLVLGAVGLRFARMGAEKDPSRKEAQRFALFAMCAGVLSLAFYGLTAEPIVESLALDDTSRWRTPWLVLSAISFALGAFPMGMIDLSLSGNPITLPKGAARKSAISGMTTALAVALVFPINYLASEYNAEWDFAYVRVTKAGESTLGLARTLPEPATVYLFYPSGSDVKERVLPYFDEVASASGGLLTVEVVDHALRPDLAEEFKVRDNGWVVVKGQEGAEEKFEIGTKLDSASRKFKKLDSLFQKHLVRATRGKRQIYFLTGHREAGAREKDNRWRKLSKIKRALQDIGFHTKDISATKGSTEDIPEDAEALVIADPLDPLLEDEVAAINRYLERGGSVLVIMSPTSDPMEGILGPVGLSKGPGPLANAKYRVRLASPHFVITDRYGTHTVVKTLSRAGSRGLAVLANSVPLLEDKSVTAASRTVLIRTYEGTWADVDLDTEKDEGEEEQSWQVAYAVEGPERDGEDGFRMAVIGSVGMFSDAAWQSQWPAGPILLRDTLRWLGHDDEIVGDVASEEDVKIQHTKDGQGLWFLGVLFAMPALVLAFGFGFATLRRMRRSS